MNIIEVTNENEKLKFADMDLLDLMERSAFPSSHIFGAVDDSDVPAGCVMVSEDMDELVIEWIYVKPEYRGRGVSYLLLERVKAFAAAGYYRLSIYVPRLYGRSCVCPDERGYISAVFTEKLQDAVGEWSTTLEAIVRHPMFSNKSITACLKDRCDVMSLDGIGWDELVRGIRTIEDKPGAVMLYDISDREEYLDPDLSLISYERGTWGRVVNAALMIQRIGNTLYPVFAYGEDQVVLMGLIRYAVLLAEKLYPPRTKIRFFMRESVTSRRPDMYDFLDDVFQIKIPGYGRYIPAMRQSIWGGRISTPDGLDLAGWNGEL